MKGAYSGMNPVLGAVEALVDGGSVGFYASAVVAATDLPVSEVTAALISLVEQSKLELRFELRCPDNGRRVASYKKREEIPLGQEIESDRCESPEPFVVDESDLFVRFLPSRKFAAAVRRRAGDSGDPQGGNPGKVRSTWRRWGRAPRLSLP